MAKHQSENFRNVNQASDVTSLDKFGLKPEFVKNLTPEELKNILGAIAKIALIAKHPDRHQTYHNQSEYDFAGTDYRILTAFVGKIALLDDDEIRTIQDNYSNDVIDSANTTIITLQASLINSLEQRAEKAEEIALEGAYAESHKDSLTNFNGYMVIKDRLDSFDFQVFRVNPNGMVSESSRYELESKTLIKNSDEWVQRLDSLNNLDIHKTSIDNLPSSMLPLLIVKIKDDFFAQLGDGLVVNLSEYGINPNESSSEVGFDMYLITRAKKKNNQYDDNDYAEETDERLLLRYKKAQFDEERDGIATKMIGSRLFGFSLPIKFDSLENELLPLETEYLADESIEISPPIGDTNNIIESTTSRDVIDRLRSNMIITNINEVVVSSRSKIPAVIIRGKGSQREILVYGETYGLIPTS